MLAIGKPMFIKRLLSSIACHMKNAEIVPDVIDFAPLDTAKVYYPSRVSATVGNILTPYDVREPPQVTWNTHSNVLYTLCMLDPDAPSRSNPKYREWQHWLVGNIKSCNVMDGDTVFQYVGAAPPEDTGFHRYIILVFEQRGKISFDEPFIDNCTVINRPNFSVRKFAKKYALGNPFAGNFFLAKFDDYVPHVYKALGIF